MNSLFQQQRRFLHLNIYQYHLQKLSFSDHSWLSKKGHPLIKWPPPPPLPSSTNIESHPIPTPDFSQNEFSIISNLLKNARITSVSSVELALDQTGVDPDTGLVQAIFEHFDFSPKLLHNLLLWAEKKPGFEPSAKLFDSMVDVLGKGREFEDAWISVLDQIGDGKEGSTLVSVNAFVFLIRQYARAGMPQPAIRTFEFACSLDQVCIADGKTNLFEIMLDSLCKEGHVRVASEYFTRKRKWILVWFHQSRFITYH